MQKLIAYVVRALVEGVVLLILLSLALLGLTVVGIAKLYNWSVYSTETPEERDARERAEWKLKGGAL